VTALDRLLRGPAHAEALDFTRQLPPDFSRPVIRQYSGGGASGATMAASLPNDGKKFQEAARLLRHFQSALQIAVVIQNELLWRKEDLKL
jgi:hypothetical protein